MACPYRRDTPWRVPTENFSMWEQIMGSETRAGFGAVEKGFKWGLLVLLAVLFGFFFNPHCWQPEGGRPGQALALPAAGTNVQQRPTGVVTDTPSVTIASATADTTSTPTTTAHEAQIQWTFGTVTGTYTTCTAQAMTSSAVSSTAALGFGQATKFTFACSGGYGISAPVTISVIYR